MLASFMIDPHHADAGETDHLEGLIDLAAYRGSGRDAISCGSIHIRNALKNGFPPFMSEQSLRSAIESVCAKYGKVTRLKIVPVKLEETRQCFCFLRLDSASAEAELRSNHDVTPFAGDLIFFVDVAEQWTGPDR